jgi:hypothetical protein
MNPRILISATLSLRKETAVAYGGPTVTVPLSYTVVTLKKHGHMVPGLLCCARPACEPQKAASGGSSVGAV